MFQLSTCKPIIRSYFFRNSAFKAGAEAARPAISLIQELAIGDMAIYRQSLVYASWETSVNFHPMKRFKCDLLRAVRGKPIIERSFVLPFDSIRVLKAPRLHIFCGSSPFCGSSLQQLMARHHLNFRWFSSVRRQSESQTLRSLQCGLGMLVADVLVCSRTSAQVRFVLP